MVEVLPDTSSRTTDHAVRETPMTAGWAGEEKHRRSPGFGVEQILTRPVSLDVLEQALRSDFRSG